MAHSWRTFSHSPQFRPAGFKGLAWTMFSAGGMDPCKCQSLPGVRAETCRLYRLAGAIELFSRTKMVRKLQSEMACEVIKKFVKFAPD
jgi:hypothetical protein